MLLDGVRPENRVAAGIDRIAVYTPPLFLRLDQVAEARGKDSQVLRNRLMAEERSIAPLWEDAVTLAVNAGRQAMDGIDPESVRLLICATESAVDAEKPVSTWVHRHLGLSSQCRNFEVKHACYGGTAAVQMALSWLRDQADPSIRALVVTGDFSECGIGTSQELVLGCGAVALVLSLDPGLVEVEPGRSGVHAHEISDVFRPAPGVETGDPDASLLSYLDGVDETYERYVETVAKRFGERVDIIDSFDRLVFHLPFAGIARSAHRRLMVQHSGLTRGEISADFDARTLASLAYGSRMGATYPGSVYVALAGLLATDKTLIAGDRIGVYSYGSGSCAEFFSMRLSEAAGSLEARRARSAPGLEEALNQRRSVTLADYEELERSRNAVAGKPDFTPDRSSPAGLYDTHYAGSGRLGLDGIASWYRSYSWS